MAQTLSGFITLGTAAEAGPDTGAGTFVLIANPANTGTYCYIGNDGADSITATNGYPLSKTLGNQIVVTVGDAGFTSYQFISDTQNDDVIYLRIAGEGDAPPAA